MTHGLDSILLKPFEEQIKSTFNGRKSLALLHSWDEIVYKDINRIFAFQQFDKKYKFICQNEKTLFQKLKSIKSSSSLLSSSKHKNRCSSINKLPSKSISKSTSATISITNPNPKPIKTQTLPSRSQSQSNSISKSSVNVITSNNDQMNKNNMKSIAKHTKIIQPNSGITPMVTIKPSVTTTATTPNTMNYAQDQNVNQNQFNVAKQNQLNQQYAQYAQYVQYNNNNKKKMNNNTNNYYAQYAQYAQFNQPQPQQNQQQKYVQNMNNIKNKKSMNNMNNYYAQYAQYNNGHMKMNMNTKTNSSRNTTDYAQYAQYAQFANTNTNTNTNVNVNNGKSMTPATMNKTNNNTKKGAKFYEHATYYDSALQSSYQIKGGCYYYNQNGNNCQSPGGGDYNNAEITEMVVGDENSQSSQGNISALSNTMDTSSSASLSNVTDNV